MLRRSDFAESSLTLLDEFSRSVESSDGALDAFGLELLCSLLVLKAVMSMAENVLPRPKRRGSSFLLASLPPTNQCDWSSLLCARNLVRSSHKVGVHKITRQRRIPAGSAWDDPGMNVMCHWIYSLTARLSTSTFPLARSDARCFSRPASFHRQVHSLCALNFARNLSRMVVRQS